MAVSNIEDVRIDTVLTAIADTPADVMVIVDSFGHLYREQIDLLYKKYSRRWKAPARKSAFMPTTTCNSPSPTRSKRSSSGSNRADATMAGLGRGAGNCPMELLLGFLRNPEIPLRPIVKLLQEHI